MVKWQILALIALAFIADAEGRKLYDDQQNDEDDSLDCNDGRKIDDPVLLPFFEQLRGQEMIPSRMNEWIIYFDLSGGFSGFDSDWNETYLTENGLSKDNQGLPFGRVLYSNEKNVYIPQLVPITDEWVEFKVMYAEQLLLDAMETVKIYVAYEPNKEHPLDLSKSATRILQKAIKRGNPKKVYVVTSSKCDGKCLREIENPLIKLATCGAAFGKTVPVECRHPGRDIFHGSKSGRYEKVEHSEFQVDLPIKLKQELHRTMDWLLSRIAKRMRNYMEMAFAKNRFRKNPTDLYNKVNLQINKIRGSETFEASKSAQLIYNSLFDLNVYLNVTNTPYTFDKFASFNRYLDFIGRFSNWRLDTTKYANFFEPMKDICLRYAGSGSLLANPATKIFELEEGVYDLTGVICHENVLYVVSGHAMMSTVKSGLYDNRNCSFDTVFVLAKKNFTVSENLTVPGKSMAIFSPTWIIAKEHTIDLSGEEGSTGEPGGDGGDFFAFGVKFENSHFLTVVSNGGKGASGKEISDQSLFGSNKCVPPETNEPVRRYGGNYGAPGGSPGVITLKFIRSRTENVTVVRNEGEKGRDELPAICGSQMELTSVSVVEKSNSTKKTFSKMSESEVLELFRKVVRKNSRRLSYEVLTFYKDIWTSPLMGQTLDSTLRDFLNASDYSKDSREFYDITSQILHSQIKNSCEVAESQRILLDFALTTIRMESPIEGVLLSVIDIDGYLREVIERVGSSKITGEYFERKEAKFMRVIEEAKNYLNVSLLPSLQETIENTRGYLLRELSEDSSLRDPEQFEESLAMNSLLRYLATLFDHVHLSLNDFVAPPEGREPDSEGLMRKLYFYRHVRNNMTVNEMNAMRKFLIWLKSTAEYEYIDCNKCRIETEGVLKSLQESEPRMEECDRIARDLQSRLGERNLLSLGAVTCRECNGDCMTCGWCRSCQLLCPSCDRCPWCRLPEYGSPDRPYSLESRECAECNNCYKCPYCKKCDEDPNRICDSCDDCEMCPPCPQCQPKNKLPCEVCSDCSRCPSCRQCKAPAFDVNRFFFTGDDLCRRCPCSVCRSCPGCYLRPEFDEIDRDVFFGMNYWRGDKPIRRVRQPLWRMQANIAPTYVLPPPVRCAAVKKLNERDAGEDAWSNCLGNIGSRLDALFRESHNKCSGKLQAACSAALESLKKMAPDHESSVRVKCDNCNGTVEYFLNWLSAEAEKCNGVSNYNYKEVDSICSPNEGVLFNMRGCDPETFYRTYDEIRSDFLKEFSRFVSRQGDENWIQRNFLYLLTNVEMFVSEGLKFTGETVDGALRVTNALIKFRDLKAEYEKRVTELHDFSETDVYDLLTAEISMQNERLDVTSRWLSQLKKLMPWMKKVIGFLATNAKFQEVNEKIIEGTRLISEIVHNVKVVEHYRHLREYMHGVNTVDRMRLEEVQEFKTIFEKTFVADVFNKAVKISENWMFPLTKSVVELGNALRATKNSTYQEQLKAVSREVENHRKSISLYTSTQSLESKDEKILFYNWNIRTRPTLLNDLFDWKPVILVSEILDGGQINSLMANNFEMKLTAGRRQKEGAQNEIDAALDGYFFNITHSGISYFKFGSRIYRRLTETFTFRHAASPSNSTEIPQKIDFILSPYTTWILRLESTSSEEFPQAIKDKIGSIQLFGKGRYVVNCADIPEVNQKFTPLADYRRRNGK